MAAPSLFRMVTEGFFIPPVYVNADVDSFISLAAGIIELVPISPQKQVFVIAPFEVVVAFAITFLKA